MYTGSEHLIIAVYDAPVEHLGRCELNSAVAEIDHLRRSY